MSWKFWSKPKAAPVTVDSVLATFNDTISQLQVVYTNASDDIDIEKGIMSAAELRMQAAQKEKDRANAVIQKIQALVA